MTERTLSVKERTLTRQKTMFGRFRISRYIHESIERYRVELRLSERDFDLDDLPP